LKSKFCREALVAQNAENSEGASANETNDPKMHIYCDSAQQWTPIPEQSQKFAKTPG
jgi:hypothetical protein